MNILDIYKGLVPFLGESLGKDCEVVLHDFREPGHSVIAIPMGISAVAMWEHRLQILF